MVATRWWIVGHDDKTWGPFETEIVAKLSAEGRLRGDGLVCGEGEALWTPIGAVSELAGVTWPPASAPHLPAGSPPLPASSTPPVHADSTDTRPRLNELVAIPGWSTVLLSVPTLGLWGMFAFYRTMHVYRKFARVQTTNAETLFWCFLGATALGLTTLALGVGWPILVGAAVLGAFLLRETLRLRELAILQLLPQAATTPGAYPAVRSDDWHFAMWITGAVLSATIFVAFVGLPVLVAQALNWFEDWNRLAAVARRAQGGVEPPLVR